MGRGLIIDPVGAVLALLVFEGLRASGAQDATWTIIRSIGATLLIGIGIGAAAGWLTHYVMRRYWIPDFLQNPVILGVVVATFVGSNMIQHESGLLTVTIMGALLANQKTVALRHVIEFKENLRVLMISSIFILLSARVNLDELLAVAPRAALFLLALVFVVRPASVALATARSSLPWRDRAFMMAMAPRGVVAAAVSSVFAIAMVDAGREEAAVLVPITFAVIVGTVTIYGLGATWVARRLGVAGPPPQGILLVGAQPWAREIAKGVNGLGFKTLLLDSNRQRINEARMEGLDAMHGDALCETTLDELDLSGIGRLVALTPNDQVNRLAGQHFGEVFGRTEVFRIAPALRRPDVEVVSQEASGRLLFDHDMNHGYLDSRVRAGGRFKATGLTDSYGFEEFMKDQHGTARVLFVKNEAGALQVMSADVEYEPSAGDTVLSLVD